MEVTLIHAITWCTEICIYVMMHQSAPSPIEGAGTNQCH